MTKYKSSRNLAIVGTLLLALIVAANNPIGGMAFFTCLITSYMFFTMMQVDGSPKDSHRNNL